MPNENPFQSLFETLGRLPVAHAETVNRQAYDILDELLSVPVENSGRCILLRAPRAGHGKTHLLSRIQHHLGSSHEFIPLHASFGCRIDTTTVTDDVLRCLLRPLPASGGLCALDRVTRRLFAQALEPMVNSGEVPCQDRDSALTALRARPVETFDFNHPNAVTARWARENFEALGPRLSMEIAQRSGQPFREVAFWVDTWFRFAATPLDNPVRLRLLADAVRCGSPGEGVQTERLHALLGMLALLMRVVLVADDLEGISADETAALRLAAFLASLRQSVERLDVILSLNLDVWESTFIPRLSGGLVDRLSEIVIELKPLTEEEMVALLESRVPGLGSKVIERVDRNAAGFHARGLIRAAGMAWLRASAMDTPSRVSQTPPPVPTPVSAPSPVCPTPPRETELPPTAAQNPTPGAVIAPLPSRILPEKSPTDLTENPPPLPVVFRKPNEWRPVLQAVAPPEAPLALAGSKDLKTPEPLEVLEGFVAPDFQCASDAPTDSDASTVAAAPPAQAPDSAQSPVIPEIPDSDRVDKLLQQFRERYGRGGP